MPSGGCPHGLAYLQCNECNGGPICIHGDIRDICITCKYSELCVHNKRLMRCTKCSRTGEKKHFLGSFNWLHGITKFFKK